MQIEVIPATNRYVFDMMMYGANQHPDNSRYIAEQFNNFSGYLGDVGQRFVDRAKAAYEEFQNSGIHRMAKVAVGLFNRQFHPNDITPLETIEDIQCAMPVMQRYVMAQPDLRAKFHEQKCDGYSGSYIDTAPGEVGEKHRDWRRVMTGMVVMVNDPDKPYDWESTQYSDDEDTTEAPLTFREQCNIIPTWKLAKLALQAGIDVSNVHGGDVGY